MDQDYASTLKNRTQALFDRGPGVSLPAWPLGQSEEDYNQALETALGGVCLDRKLLYTGLHRRGIEACDVLLTDGTFVHVKRLEGVDARQPPDRAGSRLRGCTSLRRRGACTARREGQGSGRRPRDHSGPR